ncbi:rRNA maturation RNase YbeY [Nitrospirillum sp. BR 11163]|uniref:rRNA maturation RNase YbeY n=1 Tax=Nitrospirillum sp. BR 11163 TaxID=3104323 RepID=UPI002AFFBB3F|nr:rRNA maturation RNase YbeY [Nitrospirillum sp. BR 11163]MEA1677605.1 rRNA maturation RNase YbeY [Nitrospirillum sp. BR 11163]
MSMDAARADALEIIVEVEAGEWETTIPGVADLVTAAARKALVQALAVDAGALPEGEGEVSILLSDNAAVRVLNQRYRGKDKPTNVLSFPMLGEDDDEDDLGLPEGMERPPYLLGDIILAYETLMTEAAEQNKPVANHLTHLVIHGVLHLLGYDHIEDAEAETMERLETVILADMGIADPYRDGAGPTREDPQSEETTR